MSKRNELIFILIILLAFFLRFFNLSNSPPGLYVDEAAVGYNAFSLLKTGRDEYGKVFPVFFRSFGDYKMPLNFYLTAIPIFLFGLNVFSVRLLSAFLGSITTILIYLLAGRFFKEMKGGFSLISAFIYAISPWSIFISRVCFEGNLALFLLLLALFLQLKALEEKSRKLMYISTFTYILSAYSYHTERFIAPGIMLFVFLVKYRGSFKKNIKNIAVQFIFLFLFLVPQLTLFFSAAGQARIKALAIEGNLINNFFSLYGSYFSSRNLFFAPDPDLQRSYPEVSVFFSWMAIPFLIGIFELLRKKTGRNQIIFYFLIIFSPLPAALARDPFSTYRSYPLIFPFVLIIALGVEKLLEVLKLTAFKISFLFLVLILSLAVLYRNVFILLPNERYSSWSFGYKQIAENLKLNSYPKILLNDEVGPSYVELLFFLEYPPKEYQMERQKIDLNNYYRLAEWNREVTWGKYSIRKIEFRKDIYVKQLIVAKPIDLSDNQAGEHFLSKAFAIIAPDGSTAFNGYLTNPELKTKDNERKLKLK